jgi:hypothetical protein
MLIGLFGTGRNGSSLIGRLLDGLEDTYVHPVEELFLTAFDDLAHRGRLTRMVIQNCTTQPLAHLNGTLSTSLLGRYYRPSLELLLRYCSESTGPPKELGSLAWGNLLPQSSCGVEEFTRGYLSGIAARVRPDVSFRHHLFKSIEVAYLTDYEQRFPDMKFIHILRDPVAVCSSQKRSLLENKAVPASYLGYDWLTCMLDKRWLPHARFVAVRRGDPRHIVVRYEDLVVEPVLEIAKIAEGLGLAPPPRPTVQTIFHDLDKSNWGGNPSKKGVDSPTEIIADLQKSNGYEEVLTKREIDLIAVKTRDLLPKLNYQSSSQASMADVRRQYLLPDKWEFMNCGRSSSYLARGLIGFVYRRAVLFRDRL